MESDYWNIPPRLLTASTSSRGHTTASFPAASTGNGNSSVIPRLRRYVQEIGDAISKVMDSSSENDFFSKDDAELSVLERHLTLQGVRKQLFEFQLKVSTLSEENRYLSIRAKEAECVESLRETNQQLIVERDKLKETVETLHSEIDYNLNKHTRAYDDLHQLFQKLTQQSTETIQTNDKTRRENEMLHADRDALNEKVKLLESHIQALNGQFKECHDSDASKIEQLYSEIATLRTELNSNKSDSQQQLEKVLERSTEQLNCKDTEIKQLEIKIKQLNDTIQMNAAIVSKSQSACEIKESVMQELQLLRNQKKQFVFMEERCQNLELTLKQETAKNESLATSTTQSNVFQSHNKNLQQQLDRWKDAASVLTKDRSGVVFSPTQLKTFLQNLYNWRTRTINELQSCQTTNSQLSSELSQVKNELRRVEIELSKERVRRCSAEFEAGVLLGEVKSQDALLKRRHGTTPISSNMDHFDDTMNSSSLCDPSINKIRATVGQFNEKKEEFIKLLDDALNQNRMIAEEKEVISRKAESACLNFSRLETMLETVKKENKELEALLQIQKQTIDKLQDRVRTIEQSYGFEETETLRKEKRDAVKLSAMTREFYRNEAIIFRSIIKALLGWQIQIDMAPVGEDITITLKPGFSVSGADDDAALIFRVKSKLPPIPTEDLPRDAIEGEIGNLFRDEDFDMHLDGRFAEKWEADADWKNQLSARCSYAAFLAVTILSEQNQVLHRTAFLAARRIRSLTTSAEAPTKDDINSTTPLNTVNTIGNDAAIISN